MQKFAIKFNRERGNQPPYYYKIILRSITGGIITENESAERVITRLPRILCFQPTHTYLPPPPPIVYTRTRALEGAERASRGEGGARERERERVIVV